MPDEYPSPIIGTPRKGRWPGRKGFAMPQRGRLPSRAYGRKMWAVEMGGRRTLPKKMEGYTITYADDITPAIALYRAEIAMLPAVAKVLLEKNINLAIQKRYRTENDGSWYPLKRSYWRRKVSEGLDPRKMHRQWSGGLASAVDRLNLRVGIGPNKFQVEGLDEAFPDYTWFHEVTGIVRKNGGVWRVRRPFIYAGIMRGFQAASVQYSILSKPMMVPEMAAKGMLGIRGLGPLIWWIVPPSVVWSYIGMAADVRGLMLGYFASPEILLPYLSAFGLGKVGGLTKMPTTRKMQRRGFRRGLWGSIRK